MKKQERKALREKLILAIKKQLLENNAEVSNKFEKKVMKSVKQIVKKARIRKAIKVSDLSKSLNAIKVTKAIKNVKKKVTI